MIKRKNGFSILGVILIVVAIIVAIGIWALSGQANTSDNSANVKPLASAIITDSAKLQLAYNKLKINGVSTANIIFKPSVQDANNMLDPNNGESLPMYGSKVLLEGVAVTVPVFNKNTNFTGLSGKHDVAIYLGGVKDSVCKEINNQLYGSTDIPVFAPINEYTGFVSGASNSDPNTSVQVDLSTAPATSSLNWSKGCIRGSNAYDGNNVYFYVLQADYD